MLTVFLPRELVEGAASTGSAASAPGPAPAANDSTREAPDASAAEGAAPPPPTPAAEGAAPTPPTPTDGGAAPPSPTPTAPPKQAPSDNEQYRIQTLPEEDWPAICGAATAAALIPCKLFLQCHSSTLLIALLRPDTVPPADLATSVQGDLKTCGDALRLAMHESELREGQIALGTASASSEDQPRAEGLHYLRYDPSSNALTGQCNTDWLQADLRYLPESRDSTRFVRAVGTLNGRLHDAQAMAAGVGCADGASTAAAATATTQGAGRVHPGGGAAEPEPARPASIKPRMAPRPGGRAAEAALRRGGFVFHASSFFGVETYTQTRHTRSVPAAYGKDASRRGHAYGPAASGEHAHDKLTGVGSAAGGASTLGGANSGYEIADARFPFDAAYGRDGDVVRRKLVDAGLLPNLV